MPLVAKVGKYRLFFFSNEGNEPVHVHVESEDNHAKFWLRPVAMASSVGYTASELARLRRLLQEYEQLIEDKWNEHFHR